MKRLLSFCVVFFLSSCGIFSNTQQYDYLKEEQTEDLIVPVGSETKILDYYPVPEDIEDIQANE